MWFMDSPQMNIMNKSLDALWLKQRVISDNIANKDTPGYKAKYVQFAEILEEEKCKSPLHRYNHNDLEPTEKILAQVKVSDETSMRADGNNVNTDKELLEMDRTSMQYEYLTRKLTNEFSTLRVAIKGGR
ncbi:MAG: flagellar basal body rod protein FlgB [Oscillospiraceae bacterium]